jgi:hypothetical protein
MGSKLLHDFIAASGLRALARSSNVLTGLAILQQMHSVMRMWVDANLKEKTNITHSILPHLQEARSVLVIEVVWAYLKNPTSSPRRNEHLVNFSREGSIT